MRILRKRPGLPTTATHTHDLTFEVRRRWWPPFFSHVRFFLPRFKLRVTNDGPDLDRASVQVDVVSYDGLLSEAKKVEEGWMDALHINLDDRWKRGTDRAFTIRLPDTALPRPGTYIMRVFVLRWVPAEGKTLGLGQTLTVGASGTYASERVAKLTPLAYLHVEPTSSVLTFWVAAGTAITALGTLALALGALLSG